MCQENLPSRDTYITVAVSVKYLNYPSVGSHTYDHTVPWIASPPECLDILFHVLPHLTRSLSLAKQPYYDLGLCHPLADIRDLHVLFFLPGVSLLVISIGLNIVFLLVVQFISRPPPTHIFYLNKKTMGRQDRNS